MIKSKGRRITWFVLTLILAMGMIGSSVLAAASPVTKNDKGTGDSTTAERMIQSDHIAHLTLDKTFEKFGTTWPTNKDFFDYTIEAIKYWDNSNVSTDENGTKKTLADMPVPKIGDKALANVDGEDYKWTTRVTLGAADGTGNTGKDQANKDSNVNDAKTGKQVVDFNFTRPGYYVYKVTEDNDGVAGVTYDNHTYYVAFYVANKTQGNAVDGATIGGDAGETGTNLYVHTITAWRSQATGGTNEQIYENIVIPSTVDPSFKTSNKYYLKMKKGEEDSYSLNAAHTDVYYKANDDGSLAKTTDAEGNITVTAEKYANLAAIPNGAIYWVEVTQAEVDQMVARGEVGKVDRSRCKENEGEDVGPNKLEIDFWNETDNKDITIEKKVTGTLGDLQKEFEFTVKLKNIEDNADYEVIATGASLANAKNTGLKTKDNKYFVNVASGATTAEFKVVLKANQSIKISGLPKGAKYQVSEAASDHVASYAITSTNTETDDAKKAVIAHPSAANTQNGTALATEEETVDPTDGGITVTYTNHRDIETETGIPGFVFPLVIAAMIALIGLAAMRRRSNVSSVNDFEF